MTSAPADSGPYVGRSVARAEDRPLLTGSARFVDDLDRPGQLWARIVRSQVSHGVIRSIDAEPALAREGVVAVITSSDLPDVRVPIRMLSSSEAERVLQPPLARGVVRYVGEPVAVVVGRDPYAAEDAAAQLDIELEELEPVLDAAPAQGTTPILHADALDGNVINRVHAHSGRSVDELLSEAAIVVSDRLRVGRQTAVPLETRGLVAEHDAASGRLTVWGAAKVKHFNRGALARMLDMPERDIRLVELEVGGSFGVRGELYPEDYLIPWLAIRLARPIKWVEDRGEHLMATNHGRDAACEIEMGADAEGRLLGFRARCLIDQGAYARTHGGLLLSSILATHIAGPYRWEGFEVACAGMLSNKTPSGTYRGPSQYEAAFFRERTIDRLARELGADPESLRRSNLVPLEQMPYEMDLGEDVGSIAYDCGDHPKTWDRLMSEARYPALRHEVAERRARGELVGIGLAAYVEASGFGPVESARVVPKPEGTFGVYVGVASVGQGVGTTLAQIAADALDSPIERVEINYHDTDLVPEGMGAFASRTTTLGGNAIVGAVEDLRRRALEAGSRHLEIAEADLELSGATVRPRGSPERAIALSELGCEGFHRYEKTVPSMSMGSSLALVSIDPETASIRVERYLLVHDLGRVINPALLQGQLVGAAAQGIAGAVLEELAFDAGGQPLSASLMDYSLPTAAEVPSVEAFVLELDQHSPASSNPLGVKGGGESGIIGCGAAIANAVADAVGEGGAGIRRLPVHPDAIHVLLEERPAERR